MFSDLLSTIGSGATHGMLGRVLGTGDTTPVGGTHTAAGHMTGIGITAMPIITTTTAALSATDIIPVTDTTRCIRV